MIRRYYICVHKVDGEIGIIAVEKQFETRMYRCVIKFDGLRKTRTDASQYIKYIHS